MPKDAEWCDVEKETPQQAAGLQACVGFLGYHFPAGWNNTDLDRDRICGAGGRPARPVNAAEIPDGKLLSPLQGAAAKL